MKKIIAGISVFGIAALGFGAYAEGWVPSGDTHNSATIVISNSADISTHASSNANTGDNEANAQANATGGSSRVNGGMNVTGDASAFTQVLVAANSNDLTVDQSGCGCGRDGDVWNDLTLGLSNSANIKTHAKAEANTGDNEANAGSKPESWRLFGGEHTSGSVRAKGGKNITGNADAQTAVGVVTNVNMIRVMQ